MEDFEAQREAVDRFINAAEQVKGALERKYKESFQGVGDAVRSAKERKERVVLRHDRELKVLVELRNVIQHNNSNKGVPIAVPRADAIEAMEGIAQLLEQPPQIKDFMVRDLVALTPESRLEDAAGLVVELALSQMPVYAEGRYVGLFTTNALARWLSSAVKANEGALLEENVRIGDILEHAEEHEVPRFVRPTEPAHKVADVLSKDTAPPVVLVTTDGAETGELQGLVTRFDVPSILRSGKVTFP